MPLQPYCKTVGYIVRAKQYDKAHQLDQSYQFGVLSRQAIGVLDQSLELVVLGESDDLQHSAEFRENLQRRTARLGVTFSLKLDGYKKIMQMNSCCLSSNRTIISKHAYFVYVAQPDLQCNLQRM